MAASDHDKRDAERIEILGDLHGEVMVFQPMAIKEISRGGAQVETAFPLHLDSLHDFRLTLGDRSVVVKGRVVHCSISDVDQEVVLYRSGIEFIEPSDRVVAVIADFVDAVKTAGARSESRCSARCAEGFADVWRDAVLGDVRRYVSRLVFTPSARGGVT